MADENQNAADLIERGGEQAKCERCKGRGQLNPQMEGQLNYLRCPDCGGSGVERGGEACCQMEARIDAALAALLSEEAS